jgi:hypothetical protein
MNDIGFIGDVAIGGTILIPVVCRNGSDVPSAPDADPTYTVFDAAGTQVGSQTGSMSLNPGSKTGFQGVVLTASEGNGYASGSLYTVHISYEISSTAYAVIAAFAVQ